MPVITKIDDDIFRIRLIKNGKCSVVYTNPANLKEIITSLWNLNTNTYRG